MLISLYMYESMYRWSNDNGEPLTDEQRDVIDLWTARAQYELIERKTVVPIGSVLPFAGIVIPDDALECDGDTFARVDYPELYDVLPNTLRVNSNTGRVPDMRSRVPRGTNLPTGAGQTVGSDQITVGLTNMPTHTHGIPFLVALPGSATPTPLPNYAVFSATAPPFQSQPSGGGVPIDHVPRSTLMRYIIIAR